MINPLNPPIHQIQRGCIRASIFENVSEDARYIVLLTRLRYEHGRWRRGGTGFRPEDLADLALLVVESTLWLNERAAQECESAPEERAPVLAAASGKEGV